MASRTPISAGNWKMNLSNDEADALCAGLAGIDEISGVQVVLAPGFLQLGRVASAFQGQRLGVAGQTMHEADSGAFTGEVSPVQLRESADWVILGHSERRQYFAETDAGLHDKVLAALAHGLQPIFCVGEQEEERELNRTEAVLKRQMDALQGVDIPLGFVVAYEPVWAIGTGKAASEAEAQEACQYLRQLLVHLAGREVADSCRVLYGGSVKPDNAETLAAQPDIDGALVGGAALDAESFLAITRAIAQTG